MAIGGARCGSSESGCGTFSVVVRTFFATLSGIGQVGGLGLIAEGIFMPTGPESATTSSVLTQASVPAPETQWVLSPTADESSFGVSFSGSF